MEMEITWAKATFTLRKWGWQIIEVQVMAGFQEQLQSEQMKTGKHKNYSKILVRDGQKNISLGKDFFVSERTEENDILSRPAKKTTLFFSKCWESEKLRQKEIITRQENGKRKERKLLPTPEFCPFMDILSDSTCIYVRVEKILQKPERLQV